MTMTEQNEDEIEIGDVEEEGNDSEELEYLAGAGTDPTDTVDLEEAEEKEPLPADGYDEKKATDPVKARIGTLTKKWRTTERAEAAALARAEAAEARLAEIEKKQEERDEEHYTANETKIKERIKNAAEDEDWAVVMQGNDELRELDKGRLNRATQQRKTAPAPAPATKEQGGAKIAPQAQRWMESNDSWFNEESPDYDAPLAKRAMRWSAKLQQDELYDPDDPALYEAINEKLGLVDGDDGNGNDGPPRFVNRGRSRSNVGQSGPRRTSKSSKTLSDHDKQVMRVFLLDPDNKDDQAQWLKRRNG